MARGGRRRRVLNEEARSASAVTLAYRAGGDADAPRYGEQANIEHHPQVTDFVPRKKRTIMLLMAAGLGTAAGAEAVAHFAGSVAKAVPGLTAADLSERIAGGAVAWTSAVMLLTAALLAKLIYNLRRHRVDDVQGRYRVWRWLSVGALLASINSVVGAQAIVAKMLAAMTGWSLTASAAEWWLAPVALVGGWIFVRLLLEISESRSSLSLVLVAAACYGVAAAGALGWSPAILETWGDALMRGLPLAGHAFALAGLVWFARYVVLDVQGLIEHAPRRATARASKKKSAESVVAIRDAASQDSYDDEQEEAGEEADGVRKLTKADRKRLRKQNRAA